jgi:hypothetical protein
VLCGPLPRAQKSRDTSRHDSAIAIRRRIHKNSACHRRGSRHKQATPDGSGKDQSKEYVMKKLLAAMLLCCASTITFAQSAAPQGGNPQRMERMVQQLQMRFSNANTTHDGKLTRQQAEAGMPRVAQYFDEIDTQKAGYITLPQIEAFMQQHGAAH